MWTDDIVNGDPVTDAEVDGPDWDKSENGALAVIFGEDHTLQLRLLRIVLQGFQVKLTRKDRGPLFQGDELFVLKHFDKVYMERIGVEFDVRKGLGVFRLSGRDRIRPNFMKEIMADPFLEVGLADRKGFFADITLTGAGHPGKSADEKSNTHKKQNKFETLHPLPIF